MRPEPADSQARAVPRGDAAPPPNLLTEEGKAALREARRGEAQPAEKRTIDAGAIPSGPSTNGPENNEPQPDTPALGTSFLGVADTGSFPPDSQIAAGPNNIVASTNGAVNILDKRGNSLSSQTLVGFFSALGTEHNDVFDPWIAYDPYINRFWVIAVSGRTTALSNIVIGLSNTQDATLDWTLWELDATVDGATDTQNWCDYPKLGFDAQAIFITCNMFRLNTTTNRNEFQYSKIRTMTKVQFVNNESFIDWWDRWDLRDGNSGSNEVFTVQPTQMFGASVADGEFLVSAQGGGGTGSTLDVWRITDVAECCDGDTTVPTLGHAARGIGSYGPPNDATQPPDASGTPRQQIDTGDARLLYAFWKNGRLSTGHTVACGSTGTNACPGFSELNVSAFPTITTLNNWALTVNGFDAYYPAATVNAADDKTMVFSMSNTSTFASANYIGIPSSADCTTCVDGPAEFLRTGQNGYVRLDTANPPRNRWGDYSGASPDPNGTGIWVVGEFAAATANTWGVQAGLTYQSAPPPANDNFAAQRAISGTNVSVGGTNQFATREPNEPDHLPTSVSQGEHSVWYRWTAPSSGSVVMDTCASNVDTTLAIYTGGTLGSLSQRTSDDDSCPSTANDNGSRASFSAVAGTTYRIAVGGWSGFSEGTFTLRLIDTRPPRVANVTPAENATGVAPATNANAVFSEAMRPPTVDGTAFNLFEAGSTTRIGATYTYDAANKRATLNPNNNLQPGTRYKAVVTTAALDLAGNRLDQDPAVSGNQQKVWFFTIRR
jgi:Bacterial Ig-like domain